MKPIPEIVKEFILKKYGRMPETDEEIDHYLDLINHGEEYKKALILKNALGAKAMKKWGLKTPEEIKTEAIKKYVTPSNSTKN